MGTGQAVPGLRGGSGRYGLRDGSGAVKSGEASFREGNGFGYGDDDSGGGGRGGGDEDGKKGGDECEDEFGEVDDMATQRSRRKLLGNVVATANSHIHNLVWNEAGELWAFGCGSNGRCGVAYYVVGANPARPRKSRMKAYMS